jgi:hypothetical protein
MNLLWAGIPYSEAPLAKTSGFPSSNVVQYLQIHNVASNILTTVATKIYSQLLTVYHVAI